MYGEFSAVYDHLMDDVDYEGWFAHYMALLCHGGMPSPKRAADLCCGTGQFALRLAARGIDTVGIDASEGMLAMAQQKARKMGVKAMFCRMDVTRFALHRPVDAMICACDGINYLTVPGAVRSFFACAHEYLTPGGVLAFDISTPYKLAQVLGGQTFGEDREDVTYLWQNDYDPKKKLCHMDLILFRKQHDGSYAKAVEHHIQRAHDVQELSQWLKEAGFSNIEVFSQMTMEPPKLEDHRIHVIAKK